MSQEIELIDKMLSQKRGFEQSSDLANKITESEKQLRALDLELENSKATLAKLEKISFSAVYHALGGSKDKKRQESLENIQELESRQTTSEQNLQQLKADFSKTETLLKTIHVDDDQILALSRMRQISQKDDLLELAIDIAKSHVMIIKIDETVGSGKRAIEKLEETAEYLETAWNLGVTAGMGSNVISAFTKHKKLETAKGVATQAQTLISQFNRELVRLNMPKTQSINLGEFARIVDTFFNELNTDIHIQSKINKASGQMFFYKQSIIQTIKDLRKKQAQETNRSKSLEQNWYEYRNHS